MSEIQDRFPVGTQVWLTTDLGPGRPAGAIGRVCAHLTESGWIEVELENSNFVTLSVASNLERWPRAVNDVIPTVSVRPGPTPEQERARMDAHFDARLSGVFNRLVTGRGTPHAVVVALRRALDDEIRQRVGASTAETPLEINWDAISTEAAARAASEPMRAAPVDEGPMRRTYRSPIDTDSLISPTITTSDDIVARGGLGAIDNSTLWIVDRLVHDGQHFADETPMGTIHRTRVRTLTHWYVRNRETEIAGPFPTEAAAAQWCQKLCTPVQRT